MLESSEPASDRKALPVFLQGQRLWGRPEREVVIEGDASLRRADVVIKADTIQYLQPRDQVSAQGHVRINHRGNVYEGPLLELRVDAFEGFFTDPSYAFLRNNSHGQAARIDFVDASHTVIHQATYTTCRRRPGPDWLPDWVLEASRITLDNDEDVGVAHGAVVRFQGVPILPIPAVSFPLSDRRKSGFLPPTIGLGTDNGVEVSVPYYWNIAPNRDATLTPRWMTQRGIDLGAEFRYLEPDYAGILKANFMGADRLSGTERWGYGYTHQGSVATALGPVRLELQAHRVSDDAYWRDFPNSLQLSTPEVAGTAVTSAGAAVTQRLLPTDAVARWGMGAFSSMVRVLRWQTLQDVNAPIVPPYDRAPQLSAHYALTNVGGLDWTLDADATRFESDPIRTAQPNAQRALAQLQIGRTWLAPAGFLAPRLQLHASTYQFDQALADGGLNATSVVPTFSIDSGLVFEREARYFGRDLVQTLEPRAFYVFTPFRDQALLPNYDTAANDFNFASIFTDNAFVGHDKISDNNLLTLGLTTRLLDSDSAAQLARFGIAQRLRFAEQRVTLNPTVAAAQAGFSDVLLGASVQVQDHWSLEATAQYNARTDQSVRSTVGARYQPGPFRTLNAAYRFQRDVSEQLDLSWQWPLTHQPDGESFSGRYYSVGRLNYSLNEGRLVDTLVGVEYDAGCWLARVVLERVQTSSATATSRLMFQLELVGLTRIGVSPLQTLSQNIARYRNLRESGAGANRFGNYD